MQESEKLERAKRKVTALTAFYIHLLIYVLAMLLLLFINVATGSVWWVQWPLLGWGIGIAFHALAVFGPAPNFVRRWQARKVKEMMDKM